MNRYVCHRGGLIGTYTRAYLCLLHEPLLEVLEVLPQPVRQPA